MPWGCDGGGYGIRTRVHGFAGRCLTTRPTHRVCLSNGKGAPDVCRMRRSQSGRPDSNRRPSPWQGDALPTELRPHDRILRSCRGRYWDRTSDLFRVKEARYPCANRPFGSSAHRSGLEESYTGSEMVRARSSVTCVPPPSQNACPSPLSEQLGAHHRRLESPDIAGSHSGPPGIMATGQRVRARWLGHHISGGQL